jgi:hypothetical protein
LGGHWPKAVTLGEVIDAGNDELVCALSTRQRANDALVERFTAAGGNLDRAKECSQLSSTRRSCSLRA